MCVDGRAIQKTSRRLIAAGSTTPQAALDANAIDPYSHYPIPLRKNGMMAMAVAIYPCCPAGRRRRHRFRHRAVPILARGAQRGLFTCEQCAAPARFRTLAGAALRKAPSRLRPSIQRFDEKSQRLVVKILSRELIYVHRDDAGGDDNPVGRRRVRPHGGGGLRRKRAKR